MTELDRLDWNLVPALDALLRERNVSRAARRLGISQSAASGALARLRRHFGDELLVRLGTTYDLTPLGQRLVPLAGSAVDTARAVLAGSRRFDPASSTREFLIRSTEYGQTLVGADLLTRVRDAGPGIRITFRWPATTGASPTDWLAGIDGWLGPRDSLPGSSSTGLVTDRWVCVVARENDEVGDELTLDDVTRLGWVVPTRPKDHDLPWRQRLFAHGLELPIAVSTESFSAVPFLVGGTRLVGIVQHSLAVRMAATADLRILECPWSMLPLSLTFWWHANREHDPAHVWLREQVAAVMQPAATR